MADNSAMLKWLAVHTGVTNMLITDQIDNPTASPALLFNFASLSDDVHVHRITLANDSTVAQVYVLQTLPEGGGPSDWEEVGRITVEPGLSWRGSFELAVGAGEELRLGIEADPSATGTSIAIVEYLAATR